MGENAHAERVAAQLAMDEDDDDAESEMGDSEDELPDVNADEPAKIRIHGSQEGVEFDIGSSFTEDEILYLKFTDDERLRQIRDFANAHLEASDDGGESA